MDLIKTDMGLLGKENFDYLGRHGVLNKEGGILYKLIDNSAFKRPVQLWNMFCLIKSDIAKSTGLSDINQIVDVMRVGQLDGEVKYPRVENIIQKGSQLVLESYKKTGEKKRSSKDIDLDNF